MCLETRPDWRLLSSIGKNWILSTQGHRQKWTASFPNTHLRPGCCLSWGTSSPPRSLGSARGKPDQSHPCLLLETFYCHQQTSSLFFLPRLTPMKILSYQKKHRIGNPPYVNYRRRWTDTSEITSSYGTEWQLVGVFLWIWNIFLLTVKI